MEKKPVFAMLFCLLAIVPGALAANEVRVTDNMHITIPPDDFIYIDVVIPDDLDVPWDTGEVEYVVECTAGSDWDDLTQQKVNTDPGNTAIIPIQFRSYGKRNGDCTGKFEIRLSSAELGKTKTWSGEVCVSNYTDIDTSSSGEQTGIDANNDNMELFDAGFAPSRKIVRPGAEAEFTLNLESYASLELEIEPGSGLEMELADTNVSMSGSSPKRSVKVNVTAPEEKGDYDFSVIVKARGCSESFCERTAVGRLLVMGASDTVSDETYTLTIFPTGLNVKDLEPIDFEVTIYNPGAAKTLSLELQLPEEMTSDFEKQEISVGKNMEKRVEFTVTPQEALGFGVIKFLASYEGKSKFVTAQISTNEMLSDSMRYADSLLENATPNSKEQINSAMEDWMAQYSDSEYGEEIQEYGSLKDRLRAAAQEQEEPQNGGDGDNDNLVIISEPEENPLSNPLVLLLVAVPVAAVAAFIIYKRRRSGIENMEV